MSNLFFMDRMKSGKTRATVDKPVPPTKAKKTEDTAVLEMIQRMLSGEDIREVLAREANPFSVSATIYLKLNQLLENLRETSNNVSLEIQNAFYDSLRQDHGYTIVPRPTKHGDIIEAQKENVIITASDSGILKGLVIDIRFNTSGRENGVFRNYGGVVTDLTLGLKEHIYVTHADQLPDVIAKVLELVQQGQDLCK